MNFPKGFLWGAATSAYQVEGGVENNDWARVQGMPKPGLACDHYHRFAEDFAIAKKLHHNAHRLSLEWSRIEPEEGRWDEGGLRHYHEVLESLKQNGMTTFVTLHHFTNPVWTAEQGGWTSKKTIKSFGNYVAKVARSLGHLVDFWITINEPSVYADMAFFRGAWPPFGKNPINYYRVYRNLLRAHNRAYEIIHSYYPAGKVGFAQDINFSEGPVRAAFNDWISIDYPFGRSKKDFIGVNQYFYHARRQRDEKKLAVTDNGWLIYPKALFEVLMKLKKYNLPIYVTENGLADKRDTRRADYIKNYIRAMAEAIGRGVDVRGYLYWSLLDNYEWPVKSGETGFEWKFGLVEVDFKDKTLARRIRKSAEAYAQICKINAI